MPDTTPEQLTFKLLFGLLEGSATGSLAIACLFALGVLLVIGNMVKSYRTRSNATQKKRK